MLLSLAITLSNILQCQCQATSHQIVIDYFPIRATPHCDRFPLDLFSILLLELTFVLCSVGHTPCGHTVYHILVLLPKY